MNGFDDLFGGKFTKEDHSFDKEAWAAKKQEERQAHQRPTDFGADAGGYSAQRL